MRRILVCCCLLAAPLRAQPALTSQTAALWLSQAEASQRFPDGVGLSTSTPAQVLLQRELPFGEVGLTSAGPHPGAVQAMPKSWEMPPFAQIGPPSAPESGPELASNAPAFADIGTGREGISRYLRPLPGGRNIRWTIEDFTVPPASSRACYVSASSGLIQLSLYQSSNSFFSEQAYFALQATLESRNELQGIGESACLGIYRDPEPKKTVTRGAGAFQDIAPVGPARPDLVDPGLQAAKKAPSFQAISTSTTTPPPLDLSKLPRPQPAEAPRARREYFVLLACFPNRSLTLEVVVDQRLGKPQDLVDIGTMLGAKVRGLR